MAKMSATQQLFAAYGALYFQRTGKKSVSIPDLLAFKDEMEAEQAQEEHDDRTHEQMVEEYGIDAHAAEMLSDMELAAMDPGEDDLPWDSQYTVK